MMELERRTIGQEEGPRETWHQVEVAARFTIIFAYPDVHPTLCIGRSMPMEYRDERV